MNKTDEDWVDSLLYAANRYLSRRPRSVKEINDYLVKRLSKKILKEEKKVPLIDKVTNILIEQEGLSDTAFAKWWIEDRSYFKPKGKRALLFELRAKGVSKEIIEEAFEKLNLNESELAKSVLSNKRASLLRVDKNKRRDHIYKLLARRGFSGAAIKKAFEEFNNIE